MSNCACGVYLPWCARRSVNVVSGIAALQYLSVPMWSTLRRLTTLVTMVGEVVMLAKTHRSEIWTAVVRFRRRSQAAAICVQCSELF